MRLLSDSEKTTIKKGLENLSFTFINTDNIKNVDSIIIYLKNTLGITVTSYSCSNLLDRINCLSELVRKDIYKQIHNSFDENVEMKTHSYKSDNVINDHFSININLLVYKEDNNIVKKITFYEKS